MDILTRPLKAALDVALQQPKMEEGLYRFLTRFRKYVRSRARHRSFLEIKHHLEEEEVWDVRGGPFSGMKFPVMTDERMQAIAPKLLGSYEAELHHIIGSLSNEPYNTIVNVGAGLGYYSTGFALRYPDAVIYAFEADAERRDICRQVASLNGVDKRVALHGRCDLQELQAALTDPKALLVIDCEGCELDLLSLKEVEPIKSADILVELHDFSEAGPTTGEIISKRFSETHDIIVINRRSKQENYVRDLGISDFESKCLQHEQRVYSVGWLLLRSKREVSAAR